MDERIGYNFTEDFISCANILEAIEDEIIVKMLLTQAHKSVIAIKQVSRNYISVVVSVNIMHPVNSITFMVNVMCYAKLRLLKFDINSFATVKKIKECLG